MVDVIFVYKETELYNRLLDYLVNQYDSRNRGLDYWNSRMKERFSDDVGAVLFCKNKESIVGFLGQTVVCDDVRGLSIWAVEKNYRKFSIRLLTEVMNYNSDLVLVNSSPNSDVQKLFDRLPQFKYKKEFVGIPLKFYQRDIKILRRHRCNIVLNGGFLNCILQSIAQRKLCLNLMNSESKYIAVKRINVYYTGLELRKNLAHYGDIFD